MSEQVNKDWLGLQGSVIVVTGAGSGIGASVAQRALLAGARVALLDVRTDDCEQLIADVQAGSDQALVLSVDVSDEGSMQAAAERIQNQWGQINGLINCAGILRPGSILDVSLDDWNRVLQVNLTGSMVCARVFSRYLSVTHPDRPASETHAGTGAGNSHAAMVFIASVAALMPQTYSGAYSASKAGVTLLSRQLSVELSDLGIRSNVVCPGMILTALSEPFYAHPGIKEAREQMTASRRIGQPEDIADAALFLVSERSSYVNGTELVVDGGLENMLMHLVPRPGYSASEA